MSWVVLGFYLVIAFSVGVLVGMIERRTNAELASQLLRQRIREQVRR